MTVTQMRMATIFNVWAFRYAADPTEFESVLDEKGDVIQDYGKKCAIYFEKLAAELDKDGLLPKPID